MDTENLLSFILPDSVHPAVADFNYINIVYSYYLSLKNCNEVIHDEIIELQKRNENQWPFFSKVRFLMCSFFKH